MQNNKKKQNFTEQEGGFAHLISEQRNLDWDE
jgi:hypothetical protein